MSTTAKDLFTSDLIQTNLSEFSAKIFLRKILMKASGQRDMSMQEVMYQILSLKFHSSSFNTITISLDGSRKLQLEDGELITKPSFLDHYAHRQKFAESFPSVVNCNFIQFLSKYFVNKQRELILRKNEVIVRTFP